MDAEDIEKRAERLYESMKQDTFSEEMIDVIEREKRRMIEEARLIQKKNGDKPDDNGNLDKDTR